MIYDQALDQIETRYADLSKDISVMRLDANDQLLNTLIAKAHVVLQLSTREGFEVKVSEALHAGRPVIATLAGGIPLQVSSRYLCVSSWHCRRARLGDTLCRS
jgi:alpha,alpha-trehalose phosphorylase (configuration-retaining)